MKILRCFVENFGVISKESFDFDGKLSCIYKENGSGKTTLLVFIKAMLFSLEATTRRSLDENERNKYRPWNGGRFGGWLEFSSETLGASYRVTRFFGEKESLDTLEIIDLATGLDASDVFAGQSIGELLFGIDAEGFERTLFLSERSLEIKNSGSLTQKISALASGDDDCYENAVKILDNKRKYYKNAQNRGYLIDLEERLRQRNGELDELLIKSENVKRLENELSEQRKNLEKASKDRKELEKRSEGLSSALVALSKQKANKALAKRLDELLEEKRAICAKYRGDTVSEADAQRVQQLINQERELRAQSSSDHADQLKEQISILSGRLEGLDITKDEIPSLLKKHADAQSVDLKGIKTQCDIAYNQYENYKNMMPSESFDETELEAAEDKKAQITELEREKNALSDKYLELSRQSGADNSQNADKKMFTALCSALGCVVFAILAVTLTPLLWIAFALLLATCAVFGITAMKARSQLFQNKQSVENEKSALDVRIQDIKDRIADLESQTERIRQKYQPFGGDIHLIKENFQRMEQQKQKYDELLQKYRDEKAKIESVNNELWNRLTPYCNAFEGQDAGQILVSMSGDLEKLELLRSSFESAKEQLRERREQIEKAGEALLSGVNALVCNDLACLDVLDAQRIHSMMLLDVSALPRLENEIVQLKTSIDSANATQTPEALDALVANKDENEVLAELEDVKRQVTELDQKILAAGGVISRLESALEVLYDRCEDIPALEQEIEEINEKYKVAEAEFYTVVKTIEYLEKAKNSLMSRYLGAIQENFLSVFTRITDSENEAVKLDAKLALKFEREGIYRDLQYFSRGMRDIMDFALRVALVKTLFGNGEAPFILLDDPFASLDEKHLEIAKRCVTDIAGEYQIVYTVCSEDRKV